MVSFFVYLCSDVLEAYTVLLLNSAHEDIVPSILPAGFHNKLFL